MPQDELKAISLLEPPVIPKGLVIYLFGGILLGASHCPQHFQMTRFDENFSARAACGSADKGQTGLAAIPPDSEFRFVNREAGL